MTAREILDSRGNPTVQATVFLKGGASGTASVPSGASTGVHEALELRDKTKRYGGKGVQKAVKHVHTKIAAALTGKDVSKPREIDRIMLDLDGTKNKKKLGANAMLAVSLASARALAKARKMPLYASLRKSFKLPEERYRMPVPTMNIINGGQHADNALSVQEFMVVPMHKRFAERVRMGAEVFHVLKALLKKKKHHTGVGDEGGFAPDLKRNEEAIRLILKAIDAAGYVAGKDIFLATDIAASEFYKNGKYYFDDGKAPIDANGMIRTMARWVKKYPFLSVEDPLAEDDWEAWQKMTDKIGHDVAVVGDDLFVTNVERLQKGIDMGVGNSILIKVNQIGTLSETIDAIYLAKKHGYYTAVSHRSGETADTFIADLAVAVNSEFIKTGSLSRSERVEKYNRLMAIEVELLNG